MTSPLAGHDEPPSGGTDQPRTSTATGLAAATYTLVAAVQKASGFVLLIVFTRLLSPSEYGTIALLTTVGALLSMTMTLGLEPRIMYGYFHIGPGLDPYLRTARRVSIQVPCAVALTLSGALFVLPISHRLTWVMECTGACLLAAGTTYAYAVLRSARRSFHYGGLALGLLLVQVVGRIVFVGVLDLGPEGWALSDLCTGLVALTAGPLFAGRLRRSDERSPQSPLQVFRSGLGLVPHYLAQWGLSLSDRLILALFVSTAAIGVYSAIAQIAAVISLMLSEVNRAFMPLYAQHEPGSSHVVPIVRLHIKVTFALYAILFLGGFAGVLWFLPSEYSSHSALYPALAVGALLYGLYLVPMNGLTLIAGVTNTAPLISLTALAINVAGNASLDPVIGIWGAVIATGIGYLVLVAMAVQMGKAANAISWSSVTGGQAYAAVLCVSVVALTLVTTFPGLVRLGSVVALSVVLLGLAFDAARGYRPSIR